MGLKRFENWPELLHSAIESRIDSRFSWGDFDCCMFAAECVKAITGEWLMPDLEYSSKETAIAVIQENGGLSNIVSEIFGNSAFPLAASRGDIVMRHDEDTGMMSLGICVGELVAFPALRGVAYVNLADCICCWKV